MKILFSINHPSQYHMFKNVAKKLVAKENEVIFFIQSRGLIEKLVQSDGFQYKFSSSPKLRSFFKRKYGIIIRGMISLIQQEIRILRFCLSHKVNFLLGTDIAITHVGFLLKIPSLVFSDDDYVFTKPYCNMAYPFASYVITPNVVNVHKWKYKNISYLGTQKTAYLHPDFFQPDVSVIEKYNLKNKRYFLLRLVTFNALHDSLHYVETGISESVLDKLIPMLEAKGQVLISFEGNYNRKYEKYVLNIDPEEIHSILYYADLFICDSQSMHVEAGLLGTPSIRSNKWVVSKYKINVIDYLEKEFGMGYSISPNDSEELLKKVAELLNIKSKKIMKEKREQFFKLNTNFSSFLYWILTNYPESIDKYKANNRIIDKFH